MSALAPFLAHGFEQARYALVNLIGLTNAHLHPATLRRALKQKAMGRLRQLEVIVRRLLTLMALGLTLGPVRPRGAAPAPVPLADGVVLAHFPAPRRFALLPRLLSGPDPDMSGFFSGFVRASGPVPAAPFIARLSALNAVLKAPEAHAKRLARALERLRKAGDPPPQVMPTGSAHRLRAELGVVAAVLPQMIRAALETWETTG